MVFERFTEKGIKVVMLAQEEARRLGHNFVGTEQILLGLIGEGTGAAAKALKSMGVTLKDARVEVERIIARGSGYVAVEIPFTPRAKRVIELAFDESRRLGTDHVGTEHLLLGLIREGEGVAARVLENLGVEYQKLRAELLKLLPEDQQVSYKNAKPEITDKKTLVSFFTAYKTDQSAQSTGVTRTPRSLIKALMNILPLDALPLVQGLEDVLREMKLALHNQEFEKAAGLLKEQIEITEKLRRFSEPTNV